MMCVLYGIISVIGVEFLGLVFFKRRTAYEFWYGLVVSEMCIRYSNQASQFQNPGLIELIYPICLLLQFHLCLL